MDTTQPDDIPEWYLLRCPDCRWRNYVKEERPRMIQCPNCQRWHDTNSLKMMNTEPLVPVESDQASDLEERWRIREGRFVCVVATF